MSVDDNYREAIRKSTIELVPGDKSEYQLRVFINNDSGDPIPISFSAAREVVITNKSLPAANTEYAHALQDNLTQVFIRNRTLADLKLAWNATESATNFFTVKAGTTKCIEGLNFSSKTLYMQSPLISTVEIEEFYT